MKHFRKLIPLAVAGALSTVSTGAAASGFQLVEQSASGLGNAYAGQGASAQDASTIFWNPAGMTRLPGRQVVGAINAIRPKAEFTNTASVPAPFQALGGNGGDAGDWAFVPNAYLSWQLSDRWFVGVGLNAPFGLKTEYDASWAGRFHAIESELKTINVNPSVAFKLSEAVSLGFGLNWQRAEATLTNSVNYTGAAVVGVCGAVPAALCAGQVLGVVPGGPVVVAPGTEGVARLEADDSSWGWNAGAMFSLGQSTRIGITYRSGIEYDLTGSVAFASRPAALAGAFPNGGITANVTLPAVASWSVFHQLNSKWDLMGDISWTQWSKLEALDIFRTSGVLLTTTPLRWSDTWRFSAGANYHVTPQWTWRFGVSYDQSPTNDAYRTPRIPDNDRTWLAVGFQYRFSKQAALDVGYAYLFIKDPTVNLCNAAQAAAEPLGCQGKNNLVGNYDSNVNILSAQLRYSF